VILCRPRGGRGVDVDVVDEPGRGYLVIEDLFLQWLWQACEWKNIWINKKNNYAKEFLLYCERKVVK
jgi:hypothetical protein